MKMINWDLLAAITLVKLLNPAAGRYITLTSGEERMTLGAHIYTELGSGGASHESIAATAGDLAFLVLGMDSFAHY